jgi:hypothetical protein
MQTGPSLRESTVATLTAVWYLLTYGISSIIILAQQSWTLSTPVFLWFLFYGFFDVVFYSAFDPTIQYAF